MIKIKVLISYLLTLVIVTLSFERVFAGNPNFASFGIKIGSNISRPTSIKKSMVEKYKIKYIPNGQISFFSEIQITNNWAFIVEIAYERRFNYIFDIIPTSGPDIYPFKLKQINHIISLPLLLKRNIFYSKDIYGLIGINLKKTLKTKENFGDLGGFGKYNDFTSETSFLLVAIDIGIGNDFKYKNMIFSPEMKISYDITSSGFYRYPISDNSHNVSVYVNFVISKIVT